MKSIAIIGAGIAGLTTAWRLKKSGFNVHVLEKSNSVGGVMSTVYEQGYLVEKGPNTILESSQEIHNLIDEIGLEEEKVYPDNCAKIRYIVKNGSLTPLPQSPPALIKSKLFSKKAKMRLCKELFVTKAVTEESIATFVERRLGKEFLDYAINPFVAGTYAGKPENLSVQHAFPKLYDLEQKYRSVILGQIKSIKQKKKQNQYFRPQICSFARGLSVLPERLLEKIGNENVTLNATVESIYLQENNLWKITGSSVLECDYIVYAGTLPGLKNLTINNDRIPEFTTLQQVYYPPVTIIALGFERKDVKHSLNGFGFLVPEIEKSKILGTLFSSSLFPQRAPKDHVLLTTFIGGARQPELALLGDDKIVSNTIGELEKYLGLKGKPTFSHLIKWEKSIPQYEVGYGKYKKIIDELEKKYPGLFFVGNYRRGVSITDTMLCANDVASNIGRVGIQNSFTF